MVLSSEKNLYEILEIPSTASSTAIKSAYRKLARKYHPDLNSGDVYCIKKFKEISEAYEILSNIEKKKNYDILRGIYHKPFRARQNEANKAYRQASQNEKEPEKKPNSNFSNVFNDILEGFKNTTSSSRNTEYKTKQLKPERGSDVYTDITISFNESIQGTARTLNVLHTEVCPNCQGRPFINGTKCHLCNGLGEQSMHKKLTVKIPSHIKHGSKIRIANEGNRGYNGGRSGDLYLNIKIENNSNFKYEGLNILTTIPITTFEAVLGATIDISAPDGKVKMKIAPNTNSGQKFRLAGEGLKEKNEQKGTPNGKKGDMIVTVNIEVPKNPSIEEIRLYKELKNITRSNIRENKWQIKQK